MRKNHSSTADSKERTRVKVGLPSKETKVNIKQLHHDPFDGTVWEDQKKRDVSMSK